MARDDPSTEPLEQNLDPPAPHKGEIFQISRAYSRTARSLENLPLRATFQMLRRSQSLRAA